MQTKNKNLKKQISRAAVILLALLSALPLILCGCGRKLEAQGAQIYDKKSGSAYSFMPAYLEAASISKKSYAKAQLSGAYQTLYTISGLDPALWLCTEWGDILYSGSDMINTLADFEPQSAYVCDTESTQNLALLKIDGEELTPLVERWQDGETTARPVSDPAETYIIKFESEKYPGIYYTVSLLEYDSALYLYSKYDGARCVEATDILEDHIYGTDADVADTASISE